MRRRRRKMISHWLMKIEGHFIHEKIAIPAATARTTRLRLLKLLAENVGSANATVADGRVYQLTDAKSEALLIVIEDLHLVYDADWVIPFFRRFLPLLPADVHVLITCRSLPPTPLWRLRSKQMLRVVEESELAFTIDEATALFETYGLSEEHARIAWRQTGGRAGSISEFAATPGRAGRAIVDSFLALNT